MKPPILEENALTVLRILYLNALKLPEHVIAHMRDDQPAAPKLLSMLHERTIVEMILDVLFEEVGLANEQISPTCCIDQRVGPLCVTGVGQDLPAAFDSQGVGWRSARVNNLIWCHDNGTHVRRFPVREFVEVDREFLLHSRRAWDQDFHGVANPLFEAWGPGDYKRAGAFGDELGVKDEKRDAPEMIAVEVRYEDHVY